MTPGRKSFETVLFGYVALYLTLTAALGLGDPAHWIGFVAVPVLLFKRLRPGARIGSYLGLERGRLSSGVGTALLVGLALSPLLLVGMPNAQDVLQLKSLVTYPIALVLLLLTAATTEEVFFRGFVMHALLTRRGPAWRAVAFSALLFAVFHLTYALTGAGQRSASVTDAGLAFVTAFAGGLLLGRTMLLTRNLLACVVMHMALDGLAASTMISFSIGG